MSVRRWSGLVVALALALGGLTACGSKSAADLGDPAKVLKTAEQKLEDTSGVTLTLTTDDLPDGVQGVQGASGTVTDAPAFDGTLTAVLSAGSFPVPIRAVDGKVYAQIPLTLGWSEVDPGDYGAPDPAQLLSGDPGRHDRREAGRRRARRQGQQGGADHLHRERPRVRGRTPDPRRHG
jgi:lipoprotein LprG